MNLEEFNVKWKSRFRPDLKFPMHTKRKIFHIYQKELFNDIDETIYNLIYEELRKEKLKSLVNIKEIKLDDFREDDEEWFLPISKNWVCGPQLKDTIIMRNIQL